MRFAIILLVILAAACCAGSMVTQGQSFEWYAQRYGERNAALILTLHLDDAFHSWWFITISAFLSLNLILCNIIRFPRLIERWRTEGQSEPSVFTEGDVSAAGISDPAAGFRALRMPSPVSCAGPDGKEAFYAVRNRAGLWGAWVCHLGILLLIVGFSLGQMTQKQYSAYGVPGDSRALGDTGLIVTIDDFRIGLREDDTVEQYTSDITVRRVSDGESRSGSVSVNHPATLFGLKFYQNSTGWAAKVSVSEGGEPLQEEVVCAGEFLRVKDKPDLVIYLNAFYPDLVMDGGMPSTATGSLNNPAYLYSVYFQNQIIGMNILMPDEVLTIDDYTVTFSEPQTYTMLQVKQDSFTFLALIGGILITAGLFLAFYIQPSSVWAVREEDGTWTFHGRSRKGGPLFREQFTDALSSLAPVSGDPAETN